MAEQSTVNIQRCNHGNAAKVVKNSFCLFALAFYFVLAHGDPHVESSHFGKSICAPHEETVPLVLWTKSTDLGSEFITSSRSKSKCNFGLDGVLTVIKDRLTVEAVKRESGPLYLLFFEENMDSVSYLQMTGGFGGRTGRNKTLIEAPKGHYATLIDYVDSITPHGLQMFAEEIALNVFPPYNRVYIVTAREDSHFAKLSGAISTMSVDAVFQAIPEIEKNGGLLLVDFGEYNNDSNTNEAADYIKRLFNSFSRERVAIYSSTISTTQNGISSSDIVDSTGSQSLELSARRTLDMSGKSVYDNSNPPETLHIMPWQLTALLSMAFLTTMLIVMINSMAIIDTSTIFSSKPLTIAKEY